MDVWSLFMQEKGEFVWAFKRKDVHNMEVYKVMGESTQRADPQEEQQDLLASPCPAVYDFLIFDVKPVPQHMDGLSMYHQEPRNAE